MQTTDAVAAIGLTLIFGVSLIGIFKTKTEGFGKYTSSLVLFVLILYLLSLFFAFGKVESHLLANAVFAVLGYAGGLVVGKSNSASS